MKKLITVAVALAITLFTVVAAEAGHHHKHRKNRRDAAPQTRGIDLVVTPVVANEAPLS